MAKKSIVEQRKAAVDRVEELSAKLADRKNTVRELEREIKEIGIELEQAKADAVKPHR